MKNVYLAQIPFGVQEKMPVYYPYSSGLLWSYAQQFQEINQHYQLKDILFLREDPDEVVERLENPDVIGLSCYVWNMRYNAVIAKKIKSKFPLCKIIVGGPHVSANDVDLFKKHSYYDVAVFSEGELLFKEVLENLYDEQKLQEVPGIGINQNGYMHKTGMGKRTEKLDDIPSPYLLGLFDGMKEHCESKGIVVNALFESNRGCPYSCTFCDWGNGVLGKVKKFDLRRVKKELLWYAKNKIEYILNCDANWGIFADRDLELTQFMCKLKRRYGYPKIFDTNWAKHSSNKIVDMAKLFLEQDMLKRFTASIQSSNPDSLKAIKRKNLPDEKAAAIIDYATEMNIHTNVELIIGLPLDTYEDFRDTFMSYMLSGAYPSVGVLTILPSSEMANPEYRKKYGMKTQLNMKKMTHVDEEDELVIETSTMSKDQTEKLILFCWFVAQWHFQGYTNIIAEFFVKKYKTSLNVFYENLIDLMCVEKQTMPNKVIHPYKNHIDKQITAELDLGAQNLPFHQLIGHDKRFETYDGLKEIVKEMLPVEDLIYLDDLLHLQEASQFSLYRSQESYINLSCSLHEYIYSNQILEQGNFCYKIIQDKTVPRNYGEYMIHNRWSNKWKNQIESYNRNLHSNKYFANNNLIPA
jgi:putative methyltransferase